MKNNIKNTILNQKVLTPYRKPEEYYNIRDDLVKYVNNCIDWKHKKVLDFFIFLVLSLRNNGKTYSTWKVIHELSLKPNKKLVYIRNTKIQLDNWISEFNGTNTQYKVINYNIFKMEYEEIELKDGTVKQKELSRTHVGYCLALSTESNYKSLAFEDVSLIVFEEFDDNDVVIGVWNKFTNLLKTIERYKTLGLIMISNKVNDNNEFLVRLGVESREEYDKEISNDNDYIVNFNKNAYLIDVAPNAYNWRETDDNSISSIFASYSPQMHDYMYGGKFLNSKMVNVKNYYKYIEDTFKPQMELIIDSVNLVFGEFIYMNEKKYCIINGDYVGKIKNLPSISFDNISFANNIDSSRGNKTELNNIATLLIELRKYNNLYYSSFEVKEICDLIISHFALSDDTIKF